MASANERNSLSDERTPLLAETIEPKPLQPQRRAAQIKPELRLRNLGFEHHNEKAFYYSQWRWPAYVFPTYRVIVAGYVVTWLYLTMLYFPHKDPYPWQCYLTNWSYTLLSMHLVLSATITLVHTLKHGNLHTRTALEEVEEEEDVISVEDQRGEGEMEEEDVRVRARVRDSTQAQSQVVRRNNATADIDADVENPHRRHNLREELIHPVERQVDNDVERTQQRREDRRNSSDNTESPPHLYQQIEQETGARDNSPSHSAQSNDVNVDVASLRNPDQQIKEEDVIDPENPDRVAVITPSSSPTRTNPSQTSLPWVMKLDWILYSIISCAAPIVTTIYFSVIYPKINRGKEPSIQDYHVHAVNSIVIFLELCLNAIPIRLSHAIYPLIYGLLYGLFSLIFWSLDHSRVIYPVILDWNDLKVTIPSLLILAFVLVPIFQLFLFGAYKLKMKLYKRLYFPEVQL